MPTAEDAPGLRSGPRVAPKFLGRTISIKDDQSRREALADAIVESDLFAKAVVNRTWASLMGRGLVEPWDELGGENDPSHPPVLEYLAAGFVRSGYDHRALLETIVLSDAYQRSSAALSPDENGTRVAAFAQAPVRPMSAEQLFRSLMMATGVENVRGRRFKRRVDQRKRQALREYQLTFADDEMGAADAFSESVPQALLLLNGALTVRGSSASLDGTRIDRILEANPSPSARIDSLFIAVYGRHPSPTEQTQFGDVLRTPGDFEDLMHAMLLSSEFTTIH